MTPRGPWLARPFGLAVGVAVVLRVPDLRRQPREQRRGLRLRGGQQELPPRGQRDAGDAVRRAALRRLVAADAAAGLVEAALLALAVAAAASTGGSRTASKRTSLYSAARFLYLHRRKSQENRVFWLHAAFG